MIARKIAYTDPEEAGAEEAYYLHSDEEEEYFVLQKGVMPDGQPTMHAYFGKPTGVYRDGGDGELTTQAYKLALSIARRQRRLNEILGIPVD